MNKLSIAAEARWICAVLCIATALAATAWADEPSPPTTINIARAPAPLFDDPIWHGASDPFVIWNPAKSEWWMYYTQRRATLEPAHGVDWVHGSAIGIAASTDGTQWHYVGVCRGDHHLADPAAAKITWWAPCLVREGGKFHMWAALVDGIYTSWIGKRNIVHFISDDGLNWKYVSTLKLSSDRVIDPDVLKIGDTWYLWYKDEAHKSHTWMAHSKDLDEWTVDSEVIGGAGHEAPFAWQWKGAYWMIVDAFGKGFRIYRSKTGLGNWVYNNTVLQNSDGRRPWDNSHGVHPGIVMQGDQCLVFYFTEFKRHCYMQLAELTLDAAGKVQCDRNRYAAPATQPAN